MNQWLTDRELSSEVRAMDAAKKSDSVVKLIGVMRNPLGIVMELVVNVFLLNL